MVRYKYEIWYYGSCISESEYEFEYEEDAQQGAAEHIQDIINYWKSEKTYEGEKQEDFDIRIKEKEIEE